MKETLAGFGILLAIIGVPVLLQEDTTEPIGTVESASWEADTASDEPQEYYEDSYIDSEYVEDRGTSECTEDCGGHSAGYEWADENGVCDENFDGGNSESFAEGVREYAEEYC